MSDSKPVSEVRVDREAFKNMANEVSGLPELFKILGDQTRTKIIYLLSRARLCTFDLAAILELSLPTISHHLSLLKSFRLVKRHREGKLVYYSLADDHIIELIETAKAHHEEAV